jgi:DNA-binding cell septation regulator SpoVG
MIGSVFLFANDYKITSVIAVDCGKYKRVRLVFNNYLVIENIKYYKDGSIEFPSYEAKSKTKYPQIVILDQNLENYILKTIKSYKEEIYNFDINKVKFRTNEISDIKNAKKRKSNIELVIDEKFLVVCGIMSGKKGLWLSWPSTKDDGYFHKDVYVLNRNLKDKIEKYVLSKYKAS